jgi:hypothetical protein
MGQFGSKFCQTRLFALALLKKYGLKYCSGFVSPVAIDQLSLAKSRLARDGRWRNLTSLYQQLMLHFETHIATPTVNFKVPLLEFIADNDMGPHGQQAIVQMNALVLGVFVHLNGLTTFRKLSEADEDQLSSDMVDVGAHQSVSINPTPHTEQALFHSIITI